MNNATRTVLARHGPSPPAVAVPSREASMRCPGEFTALKAGDGPASGWHTGHGWPISIGPGLRLTQVVAGLFNGGSLQHNELHHN